ncbi:MAG: glycosyltransferase [Cyclobacteriaceae bacterium]
MPVDLTVIIPTKDRRDILMESLDHLISSTSHLNAEVLVINDGVPFEDWNLTGIGVIKNSHHGVASARNLGARLAKSDLILFMDDDMWMTKPAIDRIIWFHRKNVNSALNVNWVYPEALRKNLEKTAFGRYLNHYGFTTLKGWNRGAIWQADQVFQTHGVTSQNLSIGKATFEHAGGYNEQFPFAGFEDHEFSARLKSKGVSVYIDPTVMTYHNEIDRQNIGNWLARKYRSGITRKVGVEMGFKELELKYSFGKHQVLNVILAFSTTLKAVVTSNLANRLKQLDLVSFRIIGSLLAASIYKGYTASAKE